VPWVGERSVACNRRRQQRIASVDSYEGGSVRRKEGMFWAIGVGFFSDA
jgi:hypothetical protein